MKMRGVVKGHEEVVVNTTGDEAMRVRVRMEPQVGGLKSVAPFIVDIDYALTTFPIGQHVEVIVNPIDAPLPPDTSDPAQMRIPEGETSGESTEDVPEPDPELDPAQ